MPLGNIVMSDGKAGAVPPKQGHVPEGLKHPYDGGLAFKNRCDLGAALSSRHRHARWLRIVPRVPCCRVCSALIARLRFLFAASDVTTTRFSHHPSANTARPSLDLKDSDRAAAYDRDHTVDYTSHLPENRGEPVGTIRRHVACGLGHGAHRNFALSCDTFWMASPLRLNCCRCEARA